MPQCLQFGDNRKTVIITGASSGLGKATVDAIANGGEYGKWHIVMAVRDVEKAKDVRALSCPESHQSSHMREGGSYSDSRLVSERAVHSLCLRSIYRIGWRASEICFAQPSSSAAPIQLRTGPFIDVYVDERCQPSGCFGQPSVSSVLPPIHANSFLESETLLPPDACHAGCRGARAEEGLLHHPGVRDELPQERQRLLQQVSF